MPTRRRPAERGVPALTALLLTVALLLGGGRARAWVEMHVSGDDVRLTVDRAGIARVEHRITIKVAGGPLRTFDLPGVDADAVPDPDGYVVPARDAAAGSLASAVPVLAELVTRGETASLRMRLGESGIRRGVYVVFVRYTTRLGERGFIDESGAMTRVRWRGPAWTDGLDAARTTFVFPAAPTEPLADDDAGASGQPEAAEADPTAPLPATVLSTVRRSPDKDEIELLRPYAPQGEAITWSVRVDARALRRRAAETGPAPNAPAAAHRSTGLVSRARATIALVGAGAVFALYALLVALKSRQAARHARAAGVTARPVVPLPLPVRAIAAGLALAGGGALQVHLRDGTAGSVLIVLAVVLAAHRSPAPGRPLRRPGRWLPVAEEEALRDPPPPSGAWLDASARGGKVLLAFALAALAAGVAAVSRVSMHHAFLLGLDVSAVLVLFGTGRIVELPPDMASAPAPMLREIARRVRRLAGPDELRVVPRIRVPIGAADADEVRLALVPRAPIRGFGSIEIGITYALGRGARVAFPEILLRVAAGSDCERAVAHLARYGRSTRGRRPEERVLAFSPRLPTARMTAAIAAALAARVTERGRKVPPTPPPARPVRPALGAAAPAPAKTKAGRRTARADRPDRVA